MKEERFNFRKTWKTRFQEKFDFWVIPNLRESAVHKCFNTKLFWKNIWNVFEKASDRAKLSLKKYWKVFRKRLVREFQVRLKHKCFPAVNLGKFFRTSSSGWLRHVLILPLSWLTSFYCFLGHETVSITNWLLLIKKVYGKETSNYLRQK